MGGLHGRRLGLALLALGWLPAAHARDWTAIGPDGGRVFALAIDPAAPRTLYAGLRGALVFRSDDAGASWEPARTGLPGGDVLTLTVDPGTPSTLYAGMLARFGGAPVYKSTDRGARWQPASVGLLGRDGRVTRAPGGALFATSNGRSPEQAPGIFRSIDGAATWTQVFEGVADPENFVFEEFGTVVVDPQAPERLVACSSQPGIVRSTDGGESWSRIESAFGAGASCDSAAAGPSPTGTLYAWVENRLWTSADGGIGWTPSAGALPSPGAPTGFLAAPGGRLYAGTFAAGGFVSLDDGASWAPLGAALQGPNAFVLVPGNPDSLYVGTDAGLHVSHDGGASAEPRQRGLGGSDVADVVVHRGAPRRLVAVAGGVLWRTTTGGREWTRTGPDGVTTETLLVDPVDPDQIYAGTFLRGVYRSSDGGLEWEPAPNLPAGRVIDLAAESLQPRALYALMYEGLTTPAVHRSVDRGATWTRLPAPPFRGIRAIAVPPAAPGTLYLVGEASSDSAVARWTAAEGWKPLAAGLQVRGHAIAVDPVAAHRIWVGGEDAVWRSVDGGETWESRSAGLPGRPVPALAVDPDDGDHVYAFTASGVFETTDGGAFWHEAATGLVPPAIERISANLALLPGRLGALFTGTQGGGVAQLDRCSAVAPARAVVTMRGLGRTRHPDRLELRGSIDLASGTALDPVGDGIEVLVDTVDGALIEVTAAGGGWRMSDSGRSWRFAGVRTGDGPAIVKALLRHPAERSAAVDFRIVVAGGDLAIDAGSFPLGAHLGPLGAGDGAQCGRLSLERAACRGTPTASRLRCRRD